MKTNFPKKTAALFAATFVIFSSSLFAQDIWQGPPGIGPNNDWFNNGNWTGGAPPIAAQDGQINNTGTAIINTHVPSAVALNLFLGFGSADSGNLRIGNSGVLTLGDSIKVGESGMGTLGIRDSGALHDVTGVIGNLNGSDGAADVRDTAVWTNSNALFIGDQGTGKLEVMDQAVVSSQGNIIVGRASGGHGRLDVQGTFAIDTNNFNVVSGSDMHIGQATDGRMDIHDGGRVHTQGDAFVGTNNGGTGLVNVGVDGPNSESFWLITPGGDVSANNAGRDGVNSVIAGNSPSGTNGDLTVGDNSGSDGTLNIHDGGLVNANGNVFIGRNGGSIGRVSIDGTGTAGFSSGFYTGNSALLSFGNLGVFVGGNSGGPGGDGILSLTNNGTVHANQLTVWGPGTGNKGILEVDSTYIIEAPITFDGGELRFLDDTDFTNNATLGNTQSPGGVFVDTNGTTSTISGVLSGPGSLVKGGAGTLIIPAGTADTYTGDTGVREGTLQLDGSITSNTFVLPDGTLTGTGTIIGNLSNDGVVSPGHSPGTLTVIHNFGNRPDGEFIAEVGGLNAGVESDLLFVGNIAIIEGGTLTVPRINNFNPVPGDRVTVIGTLGGRTGTFDTFNPVGWFGLIQPMDDYSNPFTVDIVFELTATFASQGTTRNQICVGENLDAAVDFVFDNDAAHELIGVIGQIPPEDLPEVFDLIAPEELASMYEISFQHGIMQMSTYRQRMDDLRATARGYCGDEAAPQPMEMKPDGKTVLDGKDKNVVPVETCPDKRWGMFATGYGQGVNVDDDEFNHVNGYRITTGGFSTGFDALVTHNIAIGVGGGYAQSTADLVNDGRVDVETGYVAAYATAFFGGFYVDGAATGGWSTYDTSRLGFGGFEDGETEGREFNGIIGAGYDWRMHCFTVGPFATFHYTYVEFDNFDEHGTSLAPLHFPDQNQDAQRGAIGLKASYDMTKGNIIFRPEIRAAFQHEFNNTDYAIDFSFRDIPTGHICDVFGPSTGRDSALIDAGFSLVLGKCHNISAFVFYSGNIGRENDTRHGANGGLRLSF